MFLCYDIDQTIWKIKLFYEAVCKISVKIANAFETELGEESVQIMIAELVNYVIETKMAKHSKNGTGICDHILNDTILKM